MKTLKKYNQAILIILIYGVTRLINLNIIPIFTDEAIYAYWAQIALHDPENRFISLEDGKQPLFIWFASISQYFISDPLIALRLVSVVSGLVSVLGIYLLGKLLFNKNVGLTAALLYVVLPFTLMYDRIGLYDSLLTTTIIFSTYFSVKLAQKPKVTTAVLAGVSLGLGLITKSSALFYILMLPLPFVLLNGPKKYLKGFKWLVLAGGAAFLAEVIYNSLRISPLFYMIDRKNLTFIRPFSEFFSEPFKFFVPNLRSIINWEISYLGLPLFLFFLFVSTYALFKKDKKIILLLGYISAPILVECFFNSVLYPRFTLFFLPFIILIIAYGFEKIADVLRNKLFAIATVTILLIFPVTNSYLLLTDPPNAIIADSDKNQYIQDWPAGYGVKEVTEVIKSESKNRKVYVATEGTFGLLPYALKIYFYNAANPEIVGFWPLNPNELPQQILDKSKNTQTYIVFNENQNEITNSNLELVAKYQKGNGDTYMRLYKVK